MQSVRPWSVCSAVQLSSAAWKALQAVNVTPLSGLQREGSKMTEEFWATTRENSAETDTRNENELWKIIAEALGNEPQLYVSTT